VILREALIQVNADYSLLAAHSYFQSCADFLLMWLKIDQPKKSNGLPTGKSERSFFLFW